MTRSHSGTPADARHMRASVGVDARSARSRRTSGWERFASHLIEALHRHTDLPLVELRGSGSTGLRRLGSDWATTPASARRLRHVIFPTFPPSAAVRTPFTYVLHDLTWWLYPETASSLGRHYYRPLAEMAIRRAAMVVTDTATVREEILSRFEIDERRVVCCYPGVALPTLSDNETPSAHPRPYVLAVATQEPRKNLVRLIDAYSGSGLNEEFDLVIVGRRAWGGVSPSSNGCHLLGSVSDSHLRQLYDHALALVSPSLYEGFGLPLLEAMRCGVPVVCSDIPVYREVTGGFATYFDPTNTESVAHGLRQAPSLGSQQAAASKWAQQFTWQRAAQQMSELHLETLA